MLICGGTGFIGSYIVKELLKGDYEVLIYDAFVSYVDPLGSNYEKNLKLRLKGIVDNDRVNIVRGDIRNKNRIFKIIKDFKPDYILLTAALPIASFSNEYSEDAVESNTFLKAFIESKQIINEIVTVIDEIISIEEAIIAGPAED